MRKLLLAYTTSLLMSPISGWTLGMGDIRVNSHLNQPLNAEIELHSVNKKNIEFLRIKHAANRVATGFSPTAPTPPIMRVRNGRFTNRNE
ncbi:MAG: hypothetical protein KZQ57_01895, partial [gamma proteobacterium symbiont of Lucinoma myriamae]|nr:hypothetical protein [gamma proteobacterium symbiont of Lucinoma myriamae]